MESQAGKETLKRRGVVILAALAALTGVEFWVAIGGLDASLPLLVVVALGKAALIIEYFMHLRDLMEEGDH